MLLNKKSDQLGIIAVGIALAAWLFLWLGLGWTWWISALLAAALGGTILQQMEQSAAASKLIDCKPPQSISPPRKAAFSWPVLGTFEFDIVGESFYQPVLKALTGDQDSHKSQAEFIACLIPEADNLHDSLAVRIEINGQHVGYLSRDDARSFRKRLAAKKLSNEVTTCAARIEGGWLKRDGTRAGYNVKLDIKPFW